MWQKETSKRKPRIEDQYLPDGSIIYWSRRQSSRVPVRCGKCGEERLIAE